MFLLCGDCHKWVFFGLLSIELLPHQHKTWSKHSCKVCSTCIISFPDVWSVASSANMTQATEIFVKPVLNWANVCSPEHTSDTSTNYDSFLN